MKLRFPPLAFSHRWQAFENQSETTPHHCQHVPAKRGTARDLEEASCLAWANKMSHAEGTWKIWKQQATGALLGSVWPGISLGGLGNAMAISSPLPSRAPRRLRCPQFMLEWQKWRTSRKGGSPPNEHQVLELQAANKKWRRPESHAPGCGRFSHNFIHSHINLEGLAMPSWRSGKVSRKRWTHCVMKGLIKWKHVQTGASSC